MRTCIRLIWPPAAFSALVLLVFTVGGCATTANYEKILDSWVGGHVDRLVMSWGPPQSSYQLSDGGQILEYHRSRTIPIGGYTYSVPQTTYHSGTASLYGSGGGTAYGTYSGTSTTYVQRQTPVTNVPMQCTTRFEVESTGYIRKWTWRGSDCTARAPKTTSVDVPITEVTTPSSSVEEVQDSAWQGCLTTPSSEWGSYCRRLQQLRGRK